MNQEREQIARIIDPAAFTTIRALAAERGLDVTKVPPGVILMDDTDVPIPSRQPARDAALAKADEILALRSGGEGWRATLEFHDSDCATHNEPAEPKGQCNCWIESARNLLAKERADSEDHKRFFSRYGASFLDAVDRVDAVRASPSTHGEG